MKKTKIFAVVMAAVMTLSLAACGGEQTSNDVTPTTAPTATTAPTKAPDPTATPVPAPQNVTIADASITFEDGNMSFLAPYLQHARSADVELSIVDYNGSKALKVVNLTGGSKVPFVAIDVSSLLGANVANLAGVEMVIGTSYDDGSFHSASGSILSWWGTELEEGSLGNWSVYMEKKNPKITTGKVAVGNELIADAGNILLINLTTDNGYTEEGVTATFYIDDIRFYDAAGNTLTADTTVAFVEPTGFSGSGVDNSNQYVLSNKVDFDGYATSGGGWGQNGADWSQELLDALVPGTAMEISFKSDDNTLWLVFPDSTLGWLRVGQGQAYVNNSGTTAQLTYEQIVAIAGEDKTQWGARLQFESQTAWEVYSVSVGTYSDHVAMANAVAFDGYATSGAGWAQNGADFTQELLDAIVPGSAIKVLYKSKANDMWLVFPDATAGWSRIAQGTAICDGSVAYITYDQILAVVGEDKTQWGARLQFEASDEWEVYGIEVGTLVDYMQISSLVAYDGYVTSGGAWGQNGADFTPELLSALTPGSVIEISYKSKSGDMWIVFPDATAGWSRIADGGKAICDGEKAYITYEQIVAVVGEDQSQWGARIQFEASDEWEVYGIRVGKYPVPAAEGGETTEEPKVEAPDPTIQVADGDVAFTSSKTFADASWWTQVDVSLADLLGGVDPTTVTAIKFTCPDTNFIVGYNDTLSGGWAQFDTSNSYVVKTVNFEGTDPIVCLYLSKGDSVEYTISWEVYTGGSTDIIVAEEPAEPVIDPTTDTIEGTVAYNGSLTFADSAWWTQKDLFQADLIGDLDPATVKGIKFTSDTTFFLGFTDTATGEWWQKDAASFVAKTIDFNKEEGQPVVCLYLSKGDGVEYTITWEVYTDGEAAEAPAVEAPAADLVINFAELTAGGYGYDATVNGDAVDVTIASQYQEIQYILPEVVDLAAYTTMIVDVTSNAQLDIKLVDPNAELNEYSQKAPFKDNYTAQDQAVTEPIYIDLAEFADKDLAQINFMATGNDTTFTIKSITFIK